MIIVTCPGYKRSNRHVDLALIIINYERLSFVIPTQSAHVITVDPFDGSELVPARDEKETNFEVHRVETNMNMPAIFGVLLNISYIKYHD